MLSGKIECFLCGAEMPVREPQNNNGKKKKSRWKTCSSCGAAQRRIYNGRHGRPKKVTWRRVPGCSI